MEYVDEFNQWLRPAYSARSAYYLAKDAIRGATGYYQMAKDAYGDATRWRDRGRAEYTARRTPNKANLRAQRWARFAAADLRQNLPMRIPNRSRWFPGGNRRPRRRFIRRRRTRPFKRRRTFRKNRIGRYLKDTRLRAELKTKQGPGNEHCLHTQVNVLGVNYWTYVPDSALVGGAKQQFGLPSDYRWTNAEVFEWSPTFSARGTGSDELIGDRIQVRSQLLRMVVGMETAAITAGEVPYIFAMWVTGYPQEDYDDYAFCPPADHFIDLDDPVTGWQPEEKSKDLRRRWKIRQVQRFRLNKDRHSVQINFGKVYSPGFRPIYEYDAATGDEGTGVELLVPTNRREFICLWSNVAYTNQYWNQLQYKMTYYDS